MYGRSGAGTVGRNVLVARFTRFTPFTTGASELSKVTSTTKASNTYVQRVCVCIYVAPSVCVCIYVAPSVQTLTRRSL